MTKPIVFIGMETSGRYRRAFQALGHETYSCDLLPSEDGGEEMALSADGLPLGRHMQGDVMDCLDNLWANDMWPELAIFHPDCTYMTGCAAWAFNDPDLDRYPGVGYHQRVKAGTLTGKARRDARAKALDGVRDLMGLKIRRKVIENPVGSIGTQIRKPSQVLQPYQFGDDASKATCHWYVTADGREARDMIVPIDPAKRVPGRLVNGRERWGNQTDSGQNALSPSDERWKERSRTFPGLSNACAAHWSEVVSIDI